MVRVNGCPLTLSPSGNCARPLTVSRGQNSCNAICCSTVRHQGGPLMVPGDLTQEDPVTLECCRLGAPTALALGANRNGTRPQGCSELSNPCPYFNPDTDLSLDAGQNPDTDPGHDPDPASCDIMWAAIRLLLDSSLRASWHPPPLVQGHTTRACLPKPSPNKRDPPALSVDRTSHSPTKHRTRSQTFPH